MGNHLSILNQLNEMHVVETNEGNLPNRRRIILIIKLIQVVLFPMYYQFESLDQNAAFQKLLDILKQEIPTQNKYSVTAENFYHHNPKKQLKPPIQKENIKSSHINYDLALYTLFKDYFFNKNKKPKNSPNSQQIHKNNAHSIQNQKNNITESKQKKQTNLTGKNKKVSNNIDNNIKNMKKYNLDKQKLFSSANSSELKEKYMAELIFKGVKYELKKYKLPKKQTNKEIYNQKKLNVLEDNGINSTIINQLYENDEELEEEKNKTNEKNNENNYLINKNNNNNKEYYDEENENNNYFNNKNFNNVYYNTYTNCNSCHYTTSKSSKWFTPKQNNNCYTLYNDDLMSSTIKKQKLKPKINQFEYLKKIKKIRAKLPINKIGASILEKKHNFHFYNGNLNKNNVIKNNIYNNKIHNDLNDSFRRKRRRNI